jgi:hypothetical protein
MYQRLKGAIAAYARAYIRTRSAPYRTQTPIRDLIPSPPLDRSGLRRRTYTHPVCEGLLSSPQIAFFQAPMYHFLKGAIAAYARAYIRTRSAPYRTQTPIRDLIPSPPLDRSGQVYYTHPVCEAFFFRARRSRSSGRPCISVCREPLLRTLGHTSEPQVPRIEPRHRFETSSHHLPSTGQPRTGALEAGRCPDASRWSRAARTWQGSCCGGREEVSARSR